MLIGVPDSRGCSSLYWIILGSTIKVFSSNLATTKVSINHEIKNLLCKRSDPENFP